MGCKRKINTPAGKAVRLEDFEVNSDNEDVDNQSSETLENIDNPTGEAPEDSSAKSDEDGSKIDSNNENFELNNEASSSDDEVEFNPQPHEFYSIAFTTEYKQSIKLYIGQVLSVNEGLVTFKFTRHKNTKCQ
ncbi:hypothetical protein PGB90_010626 [Kerria lacca]